MILGDLFYDLVFKINVRWDINKLEIIIVKVIIYCDSLKGLKKNVNK